MNADFSRTLALLRQEKGISQRKAAKELGISQALLSHYENGIREPGLAFVKKACNYYHVSADYLLGRTLDRDGGMIDAESLYDSSDEKGTLRGSIAATLQKKMLVNTAGVLFELLGKTNDRTLITSAGSYLGGAFYQLYRALELKQERAADMTGYRVTISGLKGGHSGMNINQGRGNANCLMARTLYSAMERCPSLRVSDLTGGQFDNVICLRADALAAVSAADAPAFEAFIKEFDATLKNEYAVTDGGISLVCEKADVPAAFSAADTSRLLHVLLALPQGVQEMSADFPGLVQTSLNLGVMRTDEHGVKCSFSVRSCIASQKDMLIQRVKAIVEFGGGTVGERSNYPGWQYDRDSALRKEIEAVYRDLSGHDGKIEATHGGLECGLFIEKIPGLDAVSRGPELHDVHSVNERLNVASTARVYELVGEGLKRSK